MNPRDGAGKSEPAAAAEIIARLNLSPHPKEGGWFRETYRSRETIPAGGSSARGGAARSASTAIYYLLTPDTVSALHRLATDEVFHFYAGDPVEQLRLFPDGRGTVTILGNDIVAGMEPQSVVPAGVWQGARLVRGGRHALLGCTVAPGFDYADYEHGRRAPLVAAYPGLAVLVAALTPG